MRAVIDRIEDGKTAVLTVIGGGDIFLPVKQFGFKVREGMWLSFDIKPDKPAEEASIERIKKLQGKLLDRVKKK
jgi:hypothetical protein